MDKHYARRMRAWLRADFDPTRHPAAEAERPPASDEVRPPRRHPAPNAGRPVHERAPEVPMRREDPGEVWPVGQRRPAPQAEFDEAWTVRRGELIIPVPDEAQLPEVLMPIPRSSRENGVRMSPAEERSRRNHPSNWHRLRREEAAKAAEQRRPDQPGGR